MRSRNSQRAHQKVLVHLQRVKAKPIIPAAVIAYVLGPETHVSASDEAALSNEIAGVERTRAALLALAPLVSPNDEAVLL